MEKEARKYSECSLPKDSEERKKILEGLLGKEVIVFYTGYGPKYAEDNESRPSFCAYSCGKVASVENHKIWERPFVLIEGEMGKYIMCSRLEERILVQDD